MDTPPDLGAREAGPYSRHIPSLDGLRGLAILGVMASHVFPGTISGSAAVRAVESIPELGAYGVDLFFVLSGFLITGILYDSLGEKRYFRTFYMRRALRIFPLYYGVLLVVFLLTPWLGVQWHGLLWSLALYLQNTTLIAGPLSEAVAWPVAFPHFWSLAVEEQFYLVWPMCVYFIRERRRLLWVCGGLSLGSIVLRFVLSMHHASYQVINTATLCRADSLLVGGALALLLRGRLHDATLRAARWVFLTALLGLAARIALIKMLHLDGDGAHPVLWATSMTVVYTLLALGSAGLIGWCLQPSRVQRIFEATWLRFLGRYSYGLYVFHFLLLADELILFRGWMQHITANKGLVVLGAGLMAFAVSLAVAYVSYNQYEKRFLKLKRFFDYKRVPVAVSE